MEDFPAVLTKQRKYYRSNGIFSALYPQFVIVGATIGRLKNYKLQCTNYK